jgi:trehalose-6-phosphatase
MNILCLSIAGLGCLVYQLLNCLILIDCALSQTQPRKQRKQQNEAERQNNFHIYPSSTIILCRNKKTNAGNFLKTYSKKEGLQSALQCVDLFIFK